MALSIFTESGAPRDFRVSSTDDEHYKKCLLCYTVKKNFYCPDCIKAGNFVHSSMPYSDRYAEKQAKLLRLKANRKHVLDRCEKLLAPKIKKDALLTEAKQSRDKIDLLRLAIEQRRNNVDERRKELSELTAYNSELRLKLPRYQKRVASLGKHAQNQRMELQNRISTYNEQAQRLAALRRARIRQFNMYIFPIYMTYDSSDSIEDMEFVCSESEAEEERPRRAQLHIVAPWLRATADLAALTACADQSRELGAGLGLGSSVGVEGEAGVGPLQRTASALALCAQLVALLAYTLDVRLPHALSLTEYCVWRACASGLGWRVRRVCACAAAVCARAALPPPAPAPAPPHTPLALVGLHTLCQAAQADDYSLGRVETWLSSELTEAWAAWEAGACAADFDADGDDEPPEHLHWPEQQEMDELSCTPPAAPAPSLVTSAAASIVSMWRGWTK